MPPILPKRDNVTEPPKFFKIKQGNKTMLLKREMYLKETGGKIGSFFGYFAQRIPTIEINNSFNIAADELKMMEPNIAEEPIFYFFRFFVANKKFKPIQNPKTRNY